jgi:hypothetical protein
VVQTECPFHGARSRPHHFSDQLAHCSLVLSGGRNRNPPCEPKYCPKYVNVEMDTHGRAVPAPSPLSPFPSPSPTPFLPSPRYSRERGRGVRGVRRAASVRGSRATYSLPSFPLLPFVQKRYSSKTGS